MQEITQKDFLGRAAAKKQAERKIGQDIEAMLPREDWQISQLGIRAVYQGFRVELELAISRKSVVIKISVEGNRWGIMKEEIKDRIETYRRVLDPGSVS